MALLLQALRRSATLSLLLVTESRACLLFTLAGQDSFALGSAARNSRAVICPLDWLTAAKHSVYPTRLDSAVPLRSSVSADSIYLRAQMSPEI